MPIQDLATHIPRFVTVAELAEYWSVSRQQIYKRIESGVLEAICLGSRLYRIRTVAALAYERRAMVQGVSRGDPSPPAADVTVTPADKLPRKIGLRRVVRGGR